MLVRIVSHSRRFDIAKYTLNVEVARKKRASFLEGESCDLEARRESAPSTGAKEGERLTDRRRRFPSDGQVYALLLLLW